MAKRLYNRTLLQIFFTLFFVACIMFVFNFIVFNNSVLTMNDQISQNNRLIAISIIQEFDRCFEEINTKIYDLNSLSEEIYNKFDQGIDIPSTRKIISTAQSLFTQSYVEGFIIFFDDSRLVLTERGTEDFRITFEKKYKNSKYPPEFWSSFAAMKHPPIVIPSEVYTDVSQPGISYERKLLSVIGNTQTKVTRLNIIVFINEKELLNHINRQDMLKDAELIVLDQDKKVILNTGNSANYDTDNYLSKLYFSSGNEVSIKKDDFEYFSVKSGYNDYIYIYKIPNSLNAAFNVIKLNQIILFSTLIIGIVISILSSLLLYKPIKNTLELIGNRYLAPGYNKFKQIHYGIEMMKRENELIINQIETIKDDIIRSIFLKLVDDTPYFQNITKDDLAYFNSIFNCRYFLVVSFNMELGLDNKTAQNVFSTKEISLTLKKHMEHHFDNCITFHYKGIQFITLIGVNKKTKYEDISTAINDIVENLMSDAFNGYNITALLSNFYSHIEDCKKAFKDIKMCTAYQTIKSIKKVITASNIDMASDIYFSTDSAEKLTNYLLTGNQEECINTINEVLDNNIEYNINYMEFTYIVTNLFTYIINAMAVIGIDRSQIVKFESEFWKIINGRRNCYEVKVFFVRVIEYTVDNLEYNSSQNKLNKEFIIQYINLHYSEDLYLEKMADIVGTTPKYFSNFFKKAFGINFVDYLNRVRISHAKEYLKNSDISINELSNKLGYNHSRTFTSIFKKYIGIPPTEYRKQYR